MKKAQGFSMNVIIIAVIALIVLVVLVAIFTGKIGDFVIGTDEETGKVESRLCSSQGGYCADDCGDDSAVDAPKGGWTDCAKQCCA